MRARSVPSTLVQVKWGGHMKQVLVTGANGRTGRRVIDKLLKHGASVRAFVRREEAARDMLAMGVGECLIGNLESEADLYRAVKDVQQLVHICPPMHPLEDRIGKALVSAAASSGVELFVEYSVLHPVIEVPHHRRKLAVEAALIDSGMPYVILQPARYMQHLNPIWVDVLRDGRHVLPFSTKTLFSLVDLEDLAEAVMRVLTQPHHAYATYQLAGPEQLSMQECAQRLTSLLGRHVEAIERDEGSYRKMVEASGAAPERIQTMLTMNRHYSAHGLAGNSNVLRWLLGREPTLFEDFVTRELLAKDA